jgi:hypothetical protein
MRRSSSRERLLWAALPAALAILTVPAGADAQDALALARVSLVESKVELAKKGATWRAAVEGGPVRIGEALRTGPDAIARLELPWMALTLGPGSTLSFPDDFLLSASLDAGRALVEAQGREALKLVTGEAEVRGQGRAVVRRQGEQTLVTCLAGRFHVYGGDSAVTLSAGRGTVVRAGRAPSAPEAVPAPPAGGMWPGKDPVYAAPGQPLELRWKGDAPAYQIELLPVGSDVVLLQRDVTAPPARIEVPWEGAFRWRVSARDKRGLEGTPSEDGLIAVDAR